jgi:hypothetical protein
MTLLALLEKLAEFGEDNDTHQTAPPSAGST